MRFYSFSPVCIIVTFAMLAHAADDPAAIELLETKGIVKGPSGFVIRAEEDVKSKFETLKLRVKVFTAARMELGEILEVLGQIEQINEMLTNVNAGLANLNFQMGTYPATYRGGRWVHGSNINDEAAFQGLKAERDGAARTRDAELIPTRDKLGRLRAGQKLKPAQDKFKDAFEAQKSAIDYMREAVTQANKTYEKLGTDAEVTQALAKLGVTRLYPSPEFVEEVQAFAQLEKAVGLKPSINDIKLNPGPAGAAIRKNVPSKASSQPGANPKLKMAQQTERNGQLKGALNLYKEVVTGSPDSEAAKTANERIKALKIILNLK